jgi:diguanylate cyclase (GGDEF)-like protein/PAS domain S-box-containing protein
MTPNGKTNWDEIGALIKDGFFVIRNHCFVYVNPAMEELLGVAAEQIIGQRFDQFVQPEMRDMVIKNYENRIRQLPAPKHYEIALKKGASGQRVDAWLEIEAIVEDGSIQAVAGTVRDIGAFKSLKKELDLAQRKLQGILENISDTVYQTDMEGNVTLINGDVVALLGYTGQEMIGTRLADYYWSPEERQKVVQAIVDNNGVITNVEAILRRKDGSPVWISTNAYVNKNDQGEPVSIEGIARNVTRQKQLEKKLEILALTDSLTNLPNRRALLDELHLRFTEAGENNTPLSVIYLDVNEFKQINDRHGHLTGDHVLLHIGSTISRCTGEGIMVGRLSGDEFLLILPHSNSHQAARVAQNLADESRRNPFQLDQQEITLSIAMGISEVRLGDKSEYSLLDRADKAMYLAKNSVSDFQIFQD